MKKTLSFLILVLISTSLSAQTFSASFMVGAPQKDFHKKNDNTGYGLQLQGTLGKPGITSPIAVGISANFMVFATDEKEKKVANAGFFDLNQKSELSSNMAQFHLFVQLAPFPGSVKPYVEILGGGNLLWTDATIKLEDDGKIYQGDNDRYKKDDSFSDFTWSYGAGAGVLVKLVPLEAMDLYLDLKARYTRGGEAEFVTVNEVDVDFDKGTMTFEPKSAFTELMTFHLGVSLFF
jgi:hypothetical protein